MIFVDDYRYTVNTSPLRPNTTIDQIKYQRKKLNLVGEGSFQEVASLATEGGCDLADSSNVNIGTPEGRREIIIDEGESTREWRLLLKSEIDKLTEVLPV